VALSPEDDLMSVENHVTFVTALPGAGYELLLLGDGKTMDREVIDRFPVISFLVYRGPHCGFNHILFPVTALKVYDFESQEYALLRPDGIVEVPGIGGFDSIEKFERQYLTL
jgi:hypothetical protein